MQWKSCTPPKLPSVIRAHNFLKGQGAGKSKMHTYTAGSDG